MKISKSIFVFVLLMLSAFILSACSKSDDGENKEHFASSQQKALEKAQGVEDMLKETEEKRRKEMEESSK